MPMLHGINAGFGKLIGADLLEQLVGFGFQVVRQCVPSNRDDLAPLADELTAAGLQPLWIADTVDQIAWLPSGAWAEFRNEPDLYKAPAQAAYLDDLVNAFVVAAASGVRLSPGAVSNLNNRGFDFLAQMLPRVPAAAPIAVHRYPDWPGFSAAHLPALTRDDEWSRLWSMINGRKVWLTEFGYHTASQAKPWYLGGGSARWSDTDVAFNATQELAYWIGHSVEVACWYQLGDGPANAPDNSAIDRYGIGRSGPDGVWSWKPVATVFK